MTQLTRGQILGLFLSLLCLGTAQVYTFTPYLTHGFLILAWCIAFCVIYIALAKE